MGALRLILALAVVCWHSGSFLGLRVMPGDQAVQAFFMISGFYMALILNTKYTGRGSYWLFISNRFLRLFPAYWCVLAAAFLTALVLRQVTSDGPLSAYQHPLTPFSFLFLATTNIILFGQDLVMFMGITPEGVLYPVRNYWATSPRLHEFLLVPQAWSLSVELWFYLLAPFLVRRRVRDVALIILACFMLRIFMYFVLALNFDPWKNKFFPTELGLFLMGALSFRMMAVVEKGPTRGASFAVVSIGFLAVTLNYGMLPELPFRGGWIVKQWTYLAMTACLLPVLFVWTRKSRYDRLLGELSYPVYIIHMLVITVLEACLSPESIAGLKSTSLLAVLVFGCTIVVSMILLRLVVDPLERYRQGRVAECDASIRSDASRVSAPHASAQQ